MLSSLSLDRDEEHKYDGDFTFIMIEMRNINMMGLYLYNDRDEEHKYDGDFNFIMIELRTGLYIYNDRDGNIN